MQDGTLGAFPGAFPLQLFRGENKIYDTCKASIYRSDNNDDVIIDELRIQEFKKILSTFPQVQYAIEDYMRVDYLALAQHYELNTSLIDLTGSIEVAAYFATQHWENGVPHPVESGIGCIRGITSPMLMSGSQLFDPRFHMIGLQCFQRPGLQDAYGLEMSPHDDLDKMGWKVYFKQNAEASRIIHLNFHIDEDKVEKLRRKGITGSISADQVETARGWLFPDEEIADVARMVKTSNAICRDVVNGHEDVLQRKGIQIMDNPVYELSEERRKELEIEYKGRPYGGVQLGARLCYIPQNW